jgi:hypothetical protein
MRHAVMAFADAVQEARLCSLRWEAAMVTLTYRDGVPWEPEHVSEVLQCYRMWMAREHGVPLVYCWVIELTKRARPHYHLLVWLPVGVLLPMADDRGWWRHGMTRTERARRPVGYLVKYSSKGFVLSDDARLPRGARLFGCGGDGDGALARHRATLPKWLQKRMPAGRAMRAAGGGWVSCDSGEWWPSPFVMRIQWDGPGGGCVVFERVVFDDEPATGHGRGPQSASSTDVVVVGEPPRVSSEVRARRAEGEQLP